MMTLGIARLRATLHHAVEATSTARRGRRNVRTGATLMTTAEVRLHVALRVVRLTITTLLHGERFVTGK